jgi:hypothetical protein
MLKGGGLPLFLLPPKIKVTEVTVTLYFYLQEQHGRVGNREGLSKRVECRAPVYLGDCSISKNNRIWVRKYVLQIRIILGSWIRIRIKVESWIQIRIKVKSRIQIRI